MNKIEIKPDKTSHINNAYGEMRQTADTKELFESLFQEDYIFPPSLRWKDGLRDIYVFEFPPETKTIYGENFEEVYTIPFPWQVYICFPKIKEIFFFTRTQQIQSLDDILNHQFMTNIYRSGAPCGGISINLTKDPITDCRNMINKIWMSSFNGGAYISKAGFRNQANKRRMAIEDEKISLFPKEALKEGYGIDFWQRKYLGWLQDRSPQELLEFEWHEADSLKNIIEWTYSAVHLETDNISKLAAKMHSLKSYESETG